MKTKDRILSETPDEIKQKVRDMANLLVNKEKAVERLERNYSELIKELELIKSKQMNSYFKKFYDETIELIKQFKNK